MRPTSPDLKKPSFVNSCPFVCFGIDVARGDARSSHRHDARLAGTAEGASDVAFVVELHGLHFGIGKPDPGGAPARLAFARRLGRRSGRVLGGTVGEQHPHADSSAPGRAPSPPGSGAEPVVPIRLSELTSSGVVGGFFAEHRERRRNARERSVMRYFSTNFQ